MEYNFLPYWYKKKMKSKNNLVSFIIIIIFVITNMYLLYNFANDCRNIENLKTSKSNIRFTHKGLIQKGMKNIVPLTYKNYDMFLKFESNYNSLINVKVHGKNISAKFKVRDMIEYENSIKKIELDSKYKILKLGVPENSSDGNELFQVDIEVV